MGWLLAASLQACKPLEDHDGERVSLRITLNGYSGYISVGFSVNFFLLFKGFQGTF